MWSSRRSRVLLDHSLREAGLSVRATPCFVPRVGAGSQSARVPRPRSSRGSPVERVPPAPNGRIELRPFSSNLSQNKVGWQTSHNRSWPEGVSIEGRAEKMAHAWWPVGFYRLGFHPGSLDCADSSALWTGLDLPGRAGSQPARTLQALANARGVGGGSRQGAGTPRGASTRVVGQTEFYGLTRDFPPHSRPSHHRPLLGHPLYLLHGRTARSTVYRGGFEGTGLARELEHGTPRSGAGAGSWPHGVCETRRPTQVLASPTSSRRLPCRGRKADSYLLCRTLDCVKQCAASRAK